MQNVQSDIGHLLRTRGDEKRDLRSISSLGGVTLYNINFLFLKVTSAETEKIQNNGGNSQIAFLKIILL